MYRYILASASPRRKELLQQVGMKFEVMKSSVKEEITKTSPWEIVSDLSFQKAQDVFQNIEYKKNLVVIGADTIVSCDNKILGKPSDKADAFRMLSMLAGRCHDVYTGVTVCMEEEVLSFSEKTVVSVFSMTKREILEYIETGEPMDKAGSYAIQGFFAAYIKRIEGDYNNVVGLPLGHLCQILREAGKWVPENVTFNADEPGRL